MKCTFESWHTCVLSTLASNMGFHFQSTTKFVLSLSEDPVVMAYKLSMACSDNIEASPDGRSSTVEIT